MTYIVYFDAVPHVAPEMYYLGAASKTTPEINRAFRFKHEAGAEAIAAMLGAQIKRLPVPADPSVASLVGDPA